MTSITTYFTTKEFNKAMTEFKKHRSLKEFYAPTLLDVTQWLTLADKTKPHHAIVTTETDGYLVSVLKQPNQNKDSYVEVMVTDTHPMYEQIHSAVAMLNVAGTQIEIEGIGEAFQSGVYHVIIDEVAHKQLAGGE